MSDDDGRWKGGGITRRAEGGMWEIARGIKWWDICLAE